MLIAHLIGGVILIASFSLRTPQASSALSLFFTSFKSMAPVSLIQQIDVFSLSPTLVDPRSFDSDVAVSTAPAITDLAVYRPSFQYSSFGSTTSANVSTESVVQEVGQDKCVWSLNENEEKPVLNAATYSNIFLSLATSCAVLTLYLTYVSHSPESMLTNVALKEISDKFLPLRP